MIAVGLTEGPQFTSVVELQVIDCAGWHFGGDRRCSVDAYPDAIAHEVYFPYRSPPEVRCCFAGLPLHFYLGGCDDGEDRPGSGVGTT